jgi:hypothetical protein
MLQKPLNVLFVSSLLIGSVLLAADSAGQAKAKPKTKPPAKPAAPSTKPTLGTSQLPGDNGKIGTIYQLGDKGAELHFTLDGATVATSFATVNQNLIAGKNERLLVLNFTVHNPLKTEQVADSRSFKFSVVSPDDKNVEFNGAVYEPQKRTSISQMLKPAQKVKLSAVIPIFAQGPITKLMVARGPGAILRYNLSESLEKSTSVFAADGISIGNDATAELGKPFDLAGYEIEIQEVAEASAAIGNYIPSATTGVYYAVVKFTNPMMQPLSVGWQYFTPVLTDENGENIHWSKDMFSMSSATAFSQDVEGGSSVRARYLFSGAKGLQLAKFKLTRNSIDRSVSVKLG